MNEHGMGICPNEDCIQYLPIESHGIIGNMRTTALVGLDGRIDWFPFPRVDASPIFASVLDSKKGGSWVLHPSNCTAGKKQELNKGETRYKQYYWPDTNVLVTRFSTEDGVAQVVDYMTVRGKVDVLSRSFHKPQVSCYPQRLIRKVTGIRGSLKMFQRCAPAFDFGRQKHTLTIDEKKALFSREDDFGICVSCSEPTLLQNRNNSLYSEFTVKQGQTIVFCLQGCCINHPAGEHCPPVKLHYGQDLLHRENKWFDQTTDYWKSWLSKCTYNGRWREEVYRSALVLKLLCVSESGAIVAAPTTSLPEAVGGERNWDYRFTWIRDAAFTLYALLRIGFTEEAQAFMSWLEARAIESQVNTQPFPLQIMYGVDGRSHLEEEVVENLSGYMNSAPVRVGNGAYDQLQLDIYGELMDSVYMFNKLGVPISFDFWMQLSKMIDWVCDNWTLKDEGLWEVRGGKQHFVYSKVLCWVAVDRGLRLADKRSLPCPSRQKWILIRDEMYKTIMDLGWSEPRQSFVQAFDSDQLDASVLIMPLVLFCSGAEPKFLATLDAIEKPPAEGGLTINHSLVFRYDTNTNIDGMTGLEGTFNMCSLWLIEAMSRAGKYDRHRLDKAQLMFEDMLGYANHLGLFAEETGPRGEQLGNFPQAFTHIALISTAFNLDREFEHKSNSKHCPEK